MKEQNMEQIVESNPFIITCNYGSWRKFTGKLPGQGEKVTYLDEK